MAMCQEPVSEAAERDDEAGDMEEGVIHQQRAAVAHDQSAEMSQPGEGPRTN